MTAQTILPANTLASDSYAVDNSVRLFADTLMTMTPSGAPTNADISTLSFWTKISGLGTNRSPIFAASNGGGVHFRTDDKVDFYNAGGSLRTTQLFRDTSAWYHIVFRTDTTDGTANDRLRVYVNGTQVTDFAARSNPDQNANTHFGSAAEHHIGCNNDAANFFNGYLAEVCFIDGLSLGPDSFGEFDSDSGIWKPIKVSGLTFGNNGFYLEFKDGSNLGDELKGTQTADWSETNLAATDQSTDTCTNNFATLNPLITGANFVFSDNNLVIAQSATNWDSAYSTMGVTSGKWYMEFKGKVGAYFDVGVTDIINAAGNVSQNSGCVAYKSNGEFARAGAVGDGLPSSITDPASSSYGVNDIIGIALDVDNEAVYFSKNGTYEVNSDPESGASKTGAVTLPNSNSLYFFAVAAYKGSAASGTAQVNFGGGSVDAISSGNADADGHGNFEFAVPSGYFALCTKNLAEYG